METTVIRDNYNKLEIRNGTNRSSFVNCHSILNMKTNKKYMSDTCPYKVKDLGEDESSKIFTSKF